MSEPHAFSDPELEGLLQELAKQDGSCLLQVPRSARPRALFEESPLPPRSTMTSLEKHLLDTKRLELAHALRQACLLALHSVEASSADCSPAHTATTTIHIPSREDLSSKTENLVRIHSAEDGSFEPLALLGSFVGGDPFGATSVQLAHAARRLEDSDNAKVYLGLGLINQRDHSAAKELLRNTAAYTHSPAIKAFCWMNTGYSQALLDQYPSAMASYRKATMLGPRLIMASASWLINAIDALDGEQAMEAAAALETTLPSNHPWLLGFAKRRALAVRGDINLDRTRLARQIAEDCNPTASVIARASL